MDKFILFVIIGVIVYFVAFAPTSQKETANKVVNQAKTTTQSAIEIAKEVSQRNASELGKVKCSSDTQCVTEFGSYAQCDLQRGICIRT